MTRITNPDQSFTESDYLFFQERLKHLKAEDVIRWAYELFHDKLTYACSFGAEGIVLVDMISKTKPDARIVFLDTHVHFAETYELIHRIKKKYPTLQIDMIEPDLTLEDQKAEYGDRLWATRPDLCCEIRKNRPLKKALEGSTAWLSGLRRDQSPTRANTEFVNQDDKFQLVKVCPLIHWSWQDVWDYIHANELPYNELHDQGYPSIGCEPCTFPVKEGEDHRAGRWSGMEKTECGLHVKPNSAKE
ncbi:phosphoadenylyl-sulfate reductase [Salipaludibacillus keqinensis]|uniref:Adenosine 5'-phosphosulfate reductase n=1 Tax=Salipaludibacillus keqinensis TaxID=2045207 RepID=A0A323T9D0_9BACI|nr:phosphoadenylyl-sulfate reductase [Salipaludibacillus keqinensis]PYZ91726.1 phosphoadenylyl-sulfate reductase [Salipaludibacillus keqinensis]